MHSHAGPEWDQVRIHIHEHLKTLFNLDDSSGIELFVMLQRVAHLSRMLDTQLYDDMELSGPRWRLLLRLLVEEELGNTTGLTPTVLSQAQRVSKNTISALLRGLEAQGFIQRTHDAGDLRTFRIQLTGAGRDYLRSTAPRRMEQLNLLLSGISSDEKAQLTGLLEKLQRSLLAQYHPLCTDTESDAAGATGAATTQERING